MDFAQVHNKRKQIEEELKAAQELAKRKEELLKAFSLVENELASDSSTPTNSDVLNFDDDGDYGKNTLLVVDAMKSMKSEYSLQEIYDFLKNTGNELNRLKISSVLSRYKRMGKITVVRQGAGRAPSYYKTINL